MILISQFFSNHPMPVCTKAIPPAVPYSQYEPGKSSNGKSKKVQLAGFTECPPYNIEKCKYGMQEEKKDI